MEIGLALAGGGIRGIAHAGVLKALDENNIKVKAIGGTSAGSIVATLYAMGYKPYYIYVLFKKYAQEIINISNASLLNGLGNLIKSKKVGFSGLNDGIMLEKMFNEIALRKRIRLIEDIKSSLNLSGKNIRKLLICAIINSPQKNIHQKGASVYE